MTGRWPPAVRSRSRIASTTWKPSSSGMWMSRSNRSKGSRSSRASASRPLTAIAAESPRRVSMCSRRSRLKSLSSAARMRSGTPGQAFRDRWPHHGRAERVTASGSPSCTITRRIVSISSRCWSGLSRMALIPSSRARPRSPGRSPEVSRMRRVAAQLGLLADHGRPGPGRRCPACGSRGVRAGRGGPGPSCARGHPWPSAASPAAVGSIA